MTAAFLLALFLSAAPPAPAADARGAAREALSRLSDEDVDGARKALAPFASGEAKDPSVALALGVLRFHEQRYEESVKLLEQAAAAGLGRDWLEQARAARAVTRDHVRAESAHFVVSHPKGKEEVLVPYLLEALEAQRAALEQDFGRVPEGKVVVEVVEDTRQLARLSTLTEKEIKTSGTIAICKFGKMIITSPKALLTGYDWLDTASHEYVHFVVTRLTDNETPIWIHEGVARWYESRWRGPGGDILSPWSAALLREAARNGKLVTFAEMHPSMAKLPSQEAAALAFAEVAVAVDVMRARGGAPAVRGVLERLARGDSPEDAVSGALGVPFPVFEKEWRRAMAERPVPPGGERQMRKLHFQGDPGSYAEWSEIPDEKARGHARLGEIFRERGRWEPARQEYAKAVRKGGAGAPMLAGRYALAALMTGRVEDAEKVLAEALAAHPEAATLHVQLGRVRLARQDWAGARESFLLANRTDPFDPEIHAGLARAAEALGDAPTASREKRFAAILGGGAGSGGRHP
ncbi:MAG TPA: tetratricopeptide repeat protein [Anaeromyxobacteraceae bacterium]|nr:tetratricopeptide repeat protein [Anaeromyxobacteraceae bacterium]